VEPVEDRESTREPCVDGDVLSMEVAERELVVAGAVCEESAVALHASGAPAVARVRVIAPAVRIGLSRLRREVVGVYAVAIRIAERLRLVPVDVEMVAVPPASALEVPLVRREPSEVMVERTVLHHQDDDVVDGRLLGRYRQEARPGERTCEGGLGARPAEQPSELGAERGGTRPRRGARQEPASSDVAPHDARNIPTMVVVEQATPEPVVTIA
jgi:hypothetical protein